MTTKVRRQQFQVVGDYVLHVPTGAHFTAYPGVKEPHRINWGMAGTRLPNGDNYRKEDVEQLARLLLEERKMGE